MSRLGVASALIAFSVSCGGSSFQSADSSGGAGSGGSSGAAGSSAGGQGGGSSATGGLRSGGAPSSGGVSDTGGSDTGGSATGGLSSGGSNSSGTSGAGTAGTGGSAGKASGGAATGGKGASGGNSGTGGKGGTAGTGGKGGSAATGGKGASGGSAGTGGSAGGCGAGCGQARECCSDHCVNLANDPKNCGGCGVTCEATQYCGGSCVTPPCEATCGSGAQCCGSACCSAGQLCCDPQGPLSRGPVCTAPSEQGTCPMGCAPLCICASPDTPIATPSGDRAIASLRPGDLVYSVDHGRFVTVPIIRIVRTPTFKHRVVRVVLAGGRALEISPRHPTADGRAFGELKPGDRLDGVDIASTDTIPYAHDATYDILPASDSGTYFAAGVLIGSTLSPAAPHVTKVSAPLSAWIAE